MSTPSTPVSRRLFLAGSALAAGVGTVAACSSPAEPTPTGTGALTPPTIPAPGTTSSSPSDPADSWAPLPVQIEGLRVLGPTEVVDRGGAVSFTVEGVHPHDLSQFLDARGVAVRGGHHCARPLHERLGVQSSTRASGYLYTTKAEVDALVDAVEYTRAFFTRPRSSRSARSSRRAS